MILPQDLSIHTILPMVLLSATGLAVLILGTGWSRTAFMARWLALSGTLLACLATAALWGRPAESFAGALVLDRFALVLHLVFQISCGITILFSFRSAGALGRRSGEYYSLLLFCTVGMMVLTAGTNLLVIFLGLEVLSISLYILSGIHRERRESIEAALKYFILGAFSTCFILYGIAFLYGASGSLDLAEIGRILGRAAARETSGFMRAGLGLMIVGFAFKIAAVPFHSWAPDVYQGAPTAITGFMATATKAAAFGGLLRVLYLSFSAPAIRETWGPVFALLAVATMVVGNLVALAQDDVKRLLAYSSIAHAGYLLIAVATATEAGVQGILFYLVSYTFMTLGAFGVIGLIGQKEGKGESFSHNLAEYAGLGYRRPILAGAMTLFLLSLTGIPPTAGFMGKFYIFRAAVGSHHVGLAILGVIFSAISAYYYLNIIVYMYMKRAPREGMEPRISFAGAIGIGISLAGTLYLGLFPTGLWGLVGNLL